MPPPTSALLDDMVRPFLLHINLLTILTICLVFLIGSFLSGSTTNLGDSSCSGRCKAGFHCGPASTYATQLECAVVKRTGVYKPGFGIPVGPLKIRVSTRNVLVV